MAEDKKISDLTIASDLTGAELIEVVQGGVNKQTTAQRISDLSGITSEFNRAFTENPVFDKNEIYYAPYLQTDDLNFVIASSGHLVDATSGARMTITFDGVHSINFGPAFNEILGVENGDIVPAGTYKVYFLYVNGEVSVNVSGVSAESSGLTKLSTPGSFVVVADGENALDMTWSDVADEVNYQIEKSLTGTGGWVLFSTPAAGSTSDTETGLNPGDIVYYRIKAVGDNVTHADSLYATAFGQTENSGDVSAPTFTFDPVNGEDEWTMNRPITITANEPIRNDNGTTIDNSNVANVITLKETNSGGTNIPFTATINGDKTVITITPTSNYGAAQVVYVAIHDVEDFDGNEIGAPEDITFTTTEWTYFNGTSNRLQLGDILDSIIAIDNTNFWLELTIRNHSTVGTRNFIAKSDGPGNQRCFIFYSVNTDIYFAYYGSGSGSQVRAIKWAGALTTAEQTLGLRYDGNVDTNGGLDRGKLFIDGVEITAGKTLSSTGGSLTFLNDSGAQLSVGVQVNNAGSPAASQYFVGEAKDFIFRSNAGATVQVNIPLLIDGQDTSGNNNDGTWV